MLRLALAACLLLAAPAAAKPGDLDRTFAHGGRIAVAGGTFGYSQASALGVDRAGRVLAAGPTEGIPVAGGFDTGTMLLRLTAGGRLASRRFLPADYPREPQRLIVRPDGSAIVAVSLIDLAGRGRIDVYRVRPDGALDASFGTGGVATLDRPGESLVLAGAGVDGQARILLAATRAIGKASSVAVLRLTPDGALDTSYGDGGIATVTHAALGASALLVRRDGSAYVAASALGYRRTRAHATVFALGPGGRRTGFLARFRLHDDHVSPDAGIAALAAGPRGTLLVAGGDTRATRDTSAAPFGWVARLTAGGAPDHRFHRFRFIARNRGTTIAAMARDRRGRIVLAGANGESELTQAAVVRLTPSGRPDRRFGGGDGLVVKQIGALAKTHLIASRALSLALDARGRILVGGVAYDDDIVDREDVGRGYFAIARLRG